MSDNESMKTQKISVTIPENIIEQVRQMAAEDSRSFSNMLSRLLAEALKEKTA